MFRRLALSVCVIAATIVGCSRGSDTRTAMSPTAPTGTTLGSGSLLGASSVAPGGVSGAMDLAFPSRLDSYMFREELETKYGTGLGRPASPRFVDREGEVVWTQEYVRYRANGCDHATAVQRVMSQIDGSAAGAICAEPAAGAVALPPRSDAFDFGRQLESKYEQMQRGPSSSSVDLEGAVIWLQEYLRYRLNSCDHSSAGEKVFSQIDGHGVAATCFMPCSYRVSPAGADVGGAAATHEAPFFRESGTTSCPWTVKSDQSWLTIVAPANGDGPTRVGYTVTVNNANTSRLGRLRFEWTGGAASFTVLQGPSTLNAMITLVDSWRSPSNTNFCFIRTLTTPCALTATANVSGSSTYKWTVEYSHPNLTTKTQTSTSSTFSFNQSCGGGSSTAEGFETPMTVTLTVTDPNGTAQTVVQTFTIKLFTC